MNKSDAVKRAVAFYFFVALFFISLPITLSYSLGYHIDYHELKIYKTGIIYISTQPSGASIYINGKRHTDLTPAQIEELRPGTYRIEVRRKGFYPWAKDLVVRPNMVTKADRIVLFPTTLEITRISKHEASDFVISNKNYIYYLTRSGLFRSNIDGSNLKALLAYSNWPKDIINKKFSPDGDKFLYFNKWTIDAVYLNLDKDLTLGHESARVEEVLTSSDPIIDAFWHSRSGYIIVFTESDIKVVELLGGGKRNIVSLYKFNRMPRGIYYDESADSLYFTDFEREADGKEMSYVYRLDLRQTFFDSLMQLLLKKEAEAGYEKR